MKKIMVWIRVIALLASLCMLIVAVSFAWFSKANTADVEEHEADAVQVVSNGTQIGNVGSTNWWSKLDIPNSDNIVFKPMVGDGVSFYARAEEWETTSGHDYDVLVPNGEKLSPAEASAAGTDYVVMDYQIINGQKTSLRLDTASYVRPATPEEGAVEGLSTYAAGAIRVCVSEWRNGVYKPIFYWIPNTTYQISGSPEDGYTAQTDGNVESAYTFRAGSDGQTVTTVATGGQANGMKKQGGVWYFWGDLGQISGLQDAELTDFEAGTPKTFRLTIWLDGEDRECTDAVIGGSIMTKIAFRTVNTDNPDGGEEG